MTNKITITDGGGMYIFSELAFDVQAVCSAAVKSYIIVGEGIIIEFKIKDCGFAFFNPN